MVVSVGAAFIIFGIVIYSGKKFVLHGMVHQTFLILWFLGSVWDWEYISFQIFPIIWSLFLAWKVRGKHIIFNVKRSEIIKLTYQILYNHGIRYEEDDGQIILLELYNDTKVVTGFCKSEIVKVYNKEIKITGETEVFLDLTDVKGTELYDEIIGEIKLRLPLFSDGESFLRDGIMTILIGIFIVGVDIGRVYGLLKR
ncbi:hypothetical protein IZY60_04275 [Lutibacter sp. B2]|nr:hypothetical protein [Lutibacter sp. B2]